MKWRLHKTCFNLSGLLLNLRTVMFHGFTFDDAEQQYDVLLGRQSSVRKRDCLRR